MASHFEGISLTFCTVGTNPTSRTFTNSIVRSTRTAILTLTTLRAIHSEVPVGAWCSTSSARPSRVTLTNSYINKLQHYEPNAFQTNKVEKISPAHQFHGDNLRHSYNYNVSGNLDQMFSADTGARTSDQCNQDDI